MSDYLYDKTGADPDVAELEGLLGAYAHRAPLRAPPERVARRRRWPAAVAVTVVAAAAVTLWLWRRDGAATTIACGGSDGFAFAVAGEPARCGGGIASRGTLPVGAWLETPGGATADMRIADIGALTVHGDSRLRLVSTGADGHRLELARGRIEARVVAPPRLFVIDTPVASAVDLGCAYELVVDDDGSTRLRVTSGAVSLEGHGLVAYAPLDTEVLAAPGRGPGTPVSITASAELRAAVARFDRGDAAAVRDIVGRAAARDTITLWNLLSRTAGDARAAVFARLDELSPLPPDLRSADILAGDAAAIEAWRERLVDRWYCIGCVEE